MFFNQRQLAKNIFSSWMEYGLRAVIALFFIPYITSVLGDDRYGVWVIIFQTINYFSLLDFGLERALIRYLSRFLGRNDFLNVNKVINTAWSIYLVVGSIIIIAAWLTATFLFDYFKIDDPALLEEGRKALVVIGVYLGCRFYLLPFGGSLGGFQRHDVANALQMGEDVVRYSVLVWLLANGYGLVALALAVFAVTLVRQGAAIVMLRKLFPEVRAALKMANRETASTLYDYSKISFGITAAWLVIFNTDSVLLGLVGSAAAAGVYAPGAQMMLYFRNIINSIGSPLTSAVSHWEANRDLEIVRRVYLKGLNYASYLSFVVAVGVMFYAQPFVALWLNPEFAETARVMMILVVSSAVFVPQILGNAILFGLGQHRYLLRVLVVEAVLKIVLSLILIRPYGVAGMAMAAAIPQLLLYTTLYPRFIGQVLQLPARKILKRTIMSGTIAVVVATPSASLAKMILSPDSWLTFFGGVGLVTIVAGLAGIAILEPADRARLRRAIGK